LELTVVVGSQRQALAIAGVSRSTWYYRRHPRPSVDQPIAQTQRAYKSRIGAGDRQWIADAIIAGWTHEVSVDHSFAAAWDTGVMLASRRTWWRIAENINQSLRPVIPKRHGKRNSKEKPVLIACRPGQVWSWDITDLYSPWIGKTYKAYKIIDVFSRDIVGWRVEDREADHLAVAMFEQAIAEHGAPEIVHSDSGPAMKSNLLRDTLTAYGVTMTHNRPYVSNDNPFSEAGFRTMKYRPGYPSVFADLDSARAYVAGYVQWYNTEHRHSGIALFTPAQVHNGTWEDTWQVREEALQNYYSRHPERFRTRPTTPSPADYVGINLPEQKRKQHQLTPHSLT